MTGPAVTRDDPLAPLREALLSRARRDADLAVQAADEDVRMLLAEAQDEARRIHEEARARGRADADAVLAAERARAGREARAIVLQARRRAYESLRTAAREAVQALRDDPHYAQLLAALRCRIVDELGATATVTEHPRGGLVGTDGSRRVDYGLDALADAVVDSLGPAVEEPWSP